MDFKDRLNELNDVWEDSKTAGNFTDVVAGNYEGVLIGLEIGENQGGKLQLIRDHLGLTKAQNVF